MSEVSEEAEPEKAERVGYGHPPLHSRFKPGRSGNPRGRPKGKRAIEAIVHEVLGQKMWVTIDGKRKRVPVEHAILMRWREQALKGDLKAARMLFELKRGSTNAEETAVAGKAMSDEDLAILAAAGLFTAPREHQDGSA